MLSQDFEIICDDSKPMEAYPPLSDEEKRHEDDFWADIEEKYLR